MMGEPTWSAAALIAWSGPQSMDISAGVSPKPWRISRRFGVTRGRRSGSCNGGVPGTRGASGTLGAAFMVAGRFSSIGLRVVVDGWVR